MPNALAGYLGYAIYFWISDGQEPVHVHISKGNPQEHATKFWITTDSVELARDSGTVDTKDMTKIIRYLKKNRARIIVRWAQKFGKVDFKR